MRIIANQSQRETDQPILNPSCDVHKPPVAICRTMCTLAIIGALTFAGCWRANPSTNLQVSDAQASQSAAVEHLLELMGKRLQLMHDVARYKWNENKPIADPDREAKLLNDVAEQARQVDFDPAWVRTFFSAQIEAAKVRQQADFDQWKAEGQNRVADSPDLAALREQIDHLNTELIAALRQADAILIRRSAMELNREFESVKEIDPRSQEWDIAVEPLRKRAGEMRL